MSGRRRKGQRAVSRFCEAAVQADGMRRVLFILLLVALACAIGFAGISIERQFAIDSCLDAGGAWDYVGSVCEL